MRPIESTPPPPKPLIIGNFGDLAKRLEKTVACVFRMDNELLEIPVKRISPALAERVRKLRRGVTPPWKKERATPQSPAGDYDPLDAKYVEAREAQELKVRALIVYSCCPIIAAQQPGLTGEDEIAKFIQSGGPEGNGIAPDNILDLIVLTAQTGGINLDEEVQRRANFTSTPGLES